MITIKGNRTTVHFAGIEARTTGTQMDYAENACGVLTRSRLATITTVSSVSEAIAFAKATRRTVCKNCQSAAENA